MILEEMTMDRLSAGDLFVLDGTPVSRMLERDRFLALDRLDAIPVSVWTGARTGPAGRAVIRIRIMEFVRK